MAVEGNKIAGKKVILMGLGILGGGLATAKWLLKRGAELTITDLRKPVELKSSVSKLGHRGKIKYVLGEHRKEDFKNADVVVVNPGVSFRNKFVKYAIKLGKRVDNELTLFLEANQSKTLAVTGTRGKTTTVNWLAHFLKSKYPKVKIAGNSTESQLLSVADKSSPNSPVVLELPSFLLEFNYQDKKWPEVAIITNIYRDHLNRYKGMADYALTKANIFSAQGGSPARGGHGAYGGKNQNKEQTLILNADNSWTEFFLKQKPLARILFFSVKPLRNNQNGIFVDKNLSIYIKKGKKKKLFYDAQVFIERWGKHNLENLLASSLAANRFGVPLPKIVKAIDTLPQVKYRQQTVFKNKKLEIINDTAATSPEATIAAVERFAVRNQNLILITGGTDRQLEFKKWALDIKRYLKPENIIFLEGSATDKMIRELKIKSPLVFKNLKQCLDRALKELKKIEKGSLILFSPGSKSFEKFKHEFDREEQFNRLVANISK